MAAGDTGAKQSTWEELNMALRREQVAVLYHRQKLSMTAIAHRLNVSVSTVHSDIVWLRESAIKAAEAEARDMIADINRGLEDVIAESWKAYEKSTQPKSVRTSQRSKNAGGKTPGSNSMAKVVKENQCGDARFLAVITTTLEKRARLFKLGGFVSDANVLPIPQGGHVVVYLPDNGRDRHQLPPPAQPLPAPAPAAPPMMEAQVTEMPPPPAPQP